jgi:L-ribulokinase
MARARKTSRVALGLDFGTESVRALLVDLAGNERGSAVVRYRHGQITERLPSTGEPLPADFALQHPGDWLGASRRAVSRAMAAAGLEKAAVVGIGVDFTSSTMLPAAADGTPLCLSEPFAREKHAWPKLWKHHGAKRQTDRINALARRRREKWLRRYGGAVGVEWMFPKILEVLEEAPAVYREAAVFVEAGDWFVWRLVGGGPDDLPRSTCQAGYKALWSKRDGYPSRAFLKALDPRLERAVEDKLRGRLLAPGTPAGELAPVMAAALGLAPGTPVSAAIIDAHAGVPGAGAAGPGTLVMVIGTSSCHMLNASVERLIPGVAGVVEGGILPGYFGYEAGQAAVGDAFDWLRRTLCHRGFRDRDFARLAKAAAALPPGAEGVLALDWLNGCRTPLMDGSLTGAFTGLTLHHGPHHLYRALLEASAFGLRWNVETLRGGGLPVKDFVATGGIPHSNPFLVDLYANVLGEPITVHPSKHGSALGAAILGALAAGEKATGFATAAAAVRALASPARRAGDRPVRVARPERKARRAYGEVYRRYRELADALRALAGRDARARGS